MGSAESVVGHVLFVLRAPGKTLTRQPPSTQKIPARVQQFAVVPRVPILNGYIIHPKSNQDKT